MDDLSLRFRRFNAWEGEYSRKWSAADRLLQFCWLQDLGFRMHGDVSRFQEAHLESLIRMQRDLVEALEVQGKRKKGNKVKEKR